MISPSRTPNGQARKGRGGGGEWLGWQREMAPPEIEGDEGESFKVLRLSTLSWHYSGNKQLHTAPS